jgi:hypothetical protein
MIFEIPISPQGRGWPRDGEREGWTGLGATSLSSSVSVFRREKGLCKEREYMIIRVQGYGEAGERTGDGRVRSESWQVFWIGSERLSEIEQYLHIGMERVQ